jgi:cell wall-associated NlpC family hydrolase
VTADIPTDLYVDLIGTPWLRGGRDSATGLDCFGLVRTMFARLGKTVPDFDSPGSKELMEQVIDREAKTWRRVERRPGVCLLMRVQGYRAHVAFQLTDDKFIHASDPAGVMLGRISLNSNIIAAYDYDPA